MRTTLQDLQAAVRRIQEAPIKEEGWAQPCPAFFPASPDLRGPDRDPVHRVLGVDLDTACVGHPGRYAVEVRSVSSRHATLRRSMPP